MKNLNKWLPVLSYDNRAKTPACVDVRPLLSLRKLVNTTAAGKLRGGWTRAFSLCLGSDMIHE